MLIPLILLLAVCVVAVLYPYVVYPVILRYMSRKTISLTGERPGTVTLVFCAYNEGESLGPKLRNVAALKAKYSQLEVLAYDDMSNDDTFALLTAQPGLLTAVRGTERRGKAHGMKQLAAMAHGDVLVFTDANVLLDESAIDRLLDWYRDASIGGVCGTLQYINEGDSSTATVGGAYWRLEEKLKSLESRSGNVMGADGSIFSIRRELYPDFPDTVLDDLTVSMAVVFEGKRLIKVDDVVAYERLVAKRSDEFARKVRIAARAFHTHLYLRPKLRDMSRTDRFKYVSRKLVRWFGGLFLMVGLAIAVVAGFLISLWAGLFAVAAAVVAAVLVLQIRRGVVGQAGDIILALVATLIGVFKAVRGQTVVTWSPAKSR